MSNVKVDESSDPFLLLVAIIFIVIRLNIILSYRWNSSKQVVTLQFSIHTQTHTLSALSGSNIGRSLNPNFLKIFPEVPGKLPIPYFRK